MQGVAAIVNGNIAMKTWDDVKTLFPYVVVGLVIAALFISVCNILMLEDKTIRNLGINVNRMRMMVSLIAVLLAAISTAIVGSISFLGLIVPHMGRLLVGSDHKRPAVDGLHNRNSEPRKVGNLFSQGNGFRIST